MRRPTRREALTNLSAALLTMEGAKAAAGDPLTYGGRAVELTLSALGNQTLRVSLRPTGKGEAHTSDDGAVVRAVTSPPLLQTASIAKSRSLHWGANRIIVSAMPLRIDVQDRRGTTVQTLQFSRDAQEARFGLGTAPLFGMGEGGPQYDRRNHEYTMRNGQYNPDQRIEGGRMPIPWIFSPEGWGLFFREPYGVTHLGGTEGKFTAAPLPAEAALEIFMVVGGEPAIILREYAELTGYPHLPPLWSFGYQQSHRTLESREEVMSEAREFRAKRLPCDTMIYLGTGFCPSGWNTGHGSFQFNSDVFPDPEKMIAELHRENYRVVLHLTQPPEKLHGLVSDGATDDAAAARYWSTHLDVFRMGVDGWWPDEGDKLSPASRLARDRMYWEGPVKARPDVRPFSLNRNGYAGIQRYGWLWTGDVNSDWRALAAQIPVGINTGLSGMPYWGTDIGGFIPTREFTGELYVRWFQFGAFSPLFRAHGRTWKLHLPWGWNTGEFGPIEIDPSQLTDKSNLHNPEVEPICRKYMELRYQLLPYVYSGAREAHETGMPLIRAMWLHYPDDPEAMSRGDQYLWGRDILVAPVIEPSAASRRVYLPKGEWFDFWNHERVSGSRVIERKVDLATMPLYIRGGAIVPFGPVKQFVAEKVEAPLTVRVFPGANGRFVLYDDDGISFRHERGDFLRLLMNWNDAGHELKLELAAGSKLFGGTREIEVRLAFAATGKNVRFDGSPLAVHL